MEQSREEFERWFKSDFHPDKTGPYIKDTMFFAWQASRSAVVIELPSVYDDAWNDQRMGFNIGIELCRETIEAQGLTVK